MAFPLPLPRALRAQGWKVKIRDKERSEPPHVTIMRGTRTWRWGLRSASFLDLQPDPSEVPEALLTVVRNSQTVLEQKWDAMYPENPIDSTEDADD